MGVGGFCPPPQGNDDDDDDDDGDLDPWPDDVSATTAYPPLIMSEPPLVYILAEEPNTWPIASPGPIQHIFLRAWPYTR